MLEQTFFHALDSGDLTTIQTLLEEHPQLAQLKYEGLNILHHAVIRGHRHCFHALVQAGIDINAFEEKMGNTALALALDLKDPKLNKIKVIKKLISLGANVNLVDAGKSLTTLELAVHSCAEAIPILFKAGAHGVAKDLLRLAVVLNKADSVRQLIALGANCFESDKNGMTPFHLAAFASTAEMMEALLENNNNASLKLRCFKGNTPLHYAALKGNAQIIRLLVQKGARLTSLNEEGQTPLILAASNQQAHVIPLFAELGDQRAQSALEEVSALRSEVDSDQHRLSNKWYQRLAKLIPTRMKNLGYLLAQVALTLTLPFVFDLPLLTLGIGVGLTAAVLFYQNYKIIKNKKLFEDDSKFKPKVKSKLEEKVKQFTQKFAEKLHLGKVELVFDNSIKNNLTAHAFQLSNLIFINKNLLTGSLPKRTLRGLLAHEFQHLALSRSWIDKVIISLNVVLTTANSFLPYIFVPLRLILLMPFMRLPLISSLIPFSANILKPMLLAPLIFFTSKFLFFKQHREEEYLADKGAVELTGDTEVADYLENLHLCNRVMAPDFMFCLSEYSHNSREWLLEQAWEHHVPILSHFLTLAKDHPPLEDRLKAIHAHKKTLAL